MRSEKYIKQRKGEIRMFKIKKESVIEKKESQESINEKLANKIDELQNTVNRLEAQLFKVKNPNGKIDLNYPTFLWSYNRYIHFTYSDDTKIHTVGLEAPLKSFSFYKVNIKDNKAYIGIRFENKDDQDNVKENYYIVDMKNETSVVVENKMLDNLNSIEWVKSL